MFDALSVVPLTPASNASPPAAKTASAPAKDGGDRGGFADVLARSKQDVKLVDVVTTAVALPDLDAGKEVAKDVEATKPDIAADVAALLAMMGADNTAAIVPAAILPPPPIPPAPPSTTGDSTERDGESATPAAVVAIGLPKAAKSSKTDNTAILPYPLTPPSPLPATDQGGERAGESATPAAVVAIGLPKAAKSSKTDTAATKPVASEQAANRSSEESAQPPASSPYARTDAFTPVAAAPVLPKPGAEREPATTLAQGASTEMPAAINVAAVGTIPIFTPPTAAPAALASLVPTHLESPSWSKDFGQHVIRLAVDGQQAAEIHLNPPDLGPIKVSIDMKGSETTLQFSAEHATTRDALEASLPRLREIFAAGGLTLAEANVDSQPQSQSQSEAGFSQNPSSSQQGGFDWVQAMKDAGRQGIQLELDDSPAAAASALPVRTSSSRVDLFA